MTLVPLRRFAIVCVVALMAAPPPTSAGYFGTTAIQFQQNDGSYSTVPIIEPNHPVPLNVNAGDHLLASYAVSPKYYGASKDQYRFRAEISWGNSTKVLFDRTLDPSRVEDDRGWQDIDIDLDHYAGVQATVRFSAERLGWWNTGNRSKGVYWGGVRMVNSIQNPKRCNIVLVSIDTLRADHTSIYGYRRKTTPTLDRLASEGVWFHDAIAQSSWTKPSHMSMMTGLLPSYHGLWLPYRLDKNEKELSQSIPTMAELLNAHGILTQAFTASGNLAARFGFCHGFRRYDELDTTRREDGPWVFDSAEKWIQDHKKEQFFLFVHTFEVHRPYRHGGLIGDKDALTDQYDSGIRYVDGLLGDLDHAISAAGLKERTVLIVTSDHGEELSERNYWPEHSHTLYDEIIRVPMVFRWPSHFVPREIPRYQAQHIDLLPTVLDILGISRTGLFLQGRSLLPILTGHEPPTTSTVISEGTYFGGGDLRSLRYQDRGLHKVIYSPSVADNTFKPQSIGRGVQNKYWMTKVVPSHGLEFYDLVADRKEKNDIAGRSDPLMKRLLEEVQKHIALSEHKTVPDPDTIVDSSGVDSELKEELRSLGY